MKEWNEGYISALDNSAERNPYLDFEKKSTRWAQGYTAALRDMDKLGCTPSGKYELRKLLEDKYSTYIRKRLEHRWSLTEAKSIPCLGSYEWKIKSHSAGTFLAATEVNGERIIIGEYRSPKEALAVLKKNEKNLATGSDIDPHIKTRYSRKADKLYNIWGVAGSLSEWAEVTDVSVSALKQRAKNNKRTLEREIKLRLLEFLKGYKENTDHIKGAITFDVYSRFISEYTNGRDIHPAAGPFTLTAPIEYWCEYIGIARSTAQSKAKKNGLNLQDYVTQEVTKKLSSKKNKERQHVHSWDVYRYCANAEEQLKPFPGRGLVDVCIKDGVCYLSNSKVLYT